MWSRIQESLEAFNWFAKLLNPQRSGETEFKIIQVALYWNSPSFAGRSHYNLSPWNLGGAPNLSQYFPATSMLTCSKSSKTIGPSVRFIARTRASKIFSSISGCFHLISIYSHTHEYWVMLCIVIQLSEFGFSETAILPSATYYLSAISREAWLGALLQLFILRCGSTSKVSKKHLLSTWNILELWVEESPGRNFM